MSGASKRTCKCGGPAAPGHVCCAMCLDMFKQRYLAKKAGKVYRRHWRGIERDYDRMHGIVRRGNNKTKGIVHEG